MNAGILNKKISVLSISEVNNSYQWTVEANIWANAERLNGINIFSSVGMGVKSVKFIMRKRNLTLHNALRWENKYCFLTDIKEIDRMCYEVTAALIEPKTCTVERDGMSTLDELNRPIYNDAIIITFPGCLTEKYIRQTYEQPMSTIETRYVLVTPKVITLNEGELVTIDNASYEVLIIHSLDEYKNEYEISARRNP